MPGTDGLHAALEQLELRIDDIDVQFRNVELASYPGGARPTSTVRIHGDGASGYGEHVGWTIDEHSALAEAAARVSRGAWSVGEWAARLRDLPAYDRTALEAAAIDLALRQCGTSLLMLARVAPRPVRYVLSFATPCDPVAHIQALACEHLEVKIDADASWTDDTWRRLAALERIAVIDFKQTGQVEDHERASRHVRDAWIEDPQPGAVAWSDDLRKRLSFDSPVTSVAALAALASPPAAVNVKPARMGGVLEAVDCLEHCRRRGIPVYIGGMFEVGAGRRLSLALAALACPDAPNDIAPLAFERTLPARLTIDSSEPGLAGDPLP